MDQTQRPKDSTDPKTTLQLGQLAAGLLADEDHSRLSTLARLEAERTLTSLPEDVVRGLLACLGHTTKKIQRGAATVLIRFAPRQPEIIEALTHRLTDPDPRLRWTAAFTLSQLDLPSPSPQRVNVSSNQTPLLDTSTLLPVLIENLGHQESDLRWAAATAVLQIAQHHAQDVAHAMIQLVRTGNAVQRRMALYCLRDLEQTDRNAQAAYLSSLSDADVMVRLAGLACLGKLHLTGEPIRNAISGLLEHDPDLGVRRSAAVACRRIGDAHPRIIAALRQAAESADASLGKAAEAALQRLELGK